MPYSHSAWGPARGVPPLDEPRGRTVGGAGDGHVELASKPGYRNHDVACLGPEVGPDNGNGFQLQSRPLVCQRSGLTERTLLVRNLPWSLATILSHGGLRLPTGRRGAESDQDVRALAVFMEAIEEAQSLDRQCVRERAAEEFTTERIAGSILTAVNTARLGGGIATAASV